MANRTQTVVLVSLILMLGNVYLGPLLPVKSEAKLIKIEDLYFECIQKKPEIILLDLNLNKLKDIKRLNKVCNTNTKEQRESKGYMAIIEPYKVDSWH